jgi:phosphatidylglycerol---prolipoprotein diacylglyceryl transferase
VGRPTASRWGVWASDGRVGVRRIPTQLLESLASLALGAATLLLFLVHQPALPGALFVGAVAGYTLCRQLLLPFRAEPSPAAAHAMASGRPNLDRRSARRV